MPRHTQTKTTQNAVRPRKGGGYGFLFSSEFFFRTTQELEYLFFCRAERNFCSHNLTLGYMTKTKQLCPVTLRQRPRRMQYVLEVLIKVAETCLNLEINLAFQLILRPS
jgi:hypothetical protein